MKALKPLSEQGISCEVIDLRSLVPLDKACILDSVRKTGRLVVVHEANRFCGFGAELAAMVAEEAFDALKGPVKRVGAPQIPVPVAPSLEKVFKPGPEDVDHGGSGDHVKIKYGCSEWSKSRTPVGRCSC
jgi:pyruvate/2-oxoglutarate/acetoin dehydrogenase E1 component